MEIIRRHRGERNIDALIPMFDLDRGVYLVVAEPCRIEKKATRVFFIVSSLQTLSGSGGARRRHWVAWSTIQRPVAEGGLGVRNLKQVQVALAIKILWNIHHGSPYWARMPTYEDYNHLFIYGDLAASLWTWFHPLITPKGRCLAKFESKRPSAIIIGKIKFMISNSIAHMNFKVHAPAPQELQMELAKETRESVREVGASVTSRVRFLWDSLISMAMEIVW
ncbi:hypothetical protein Taro_019656 [Colocasia esculenta]|uniref:Uncharacterized protein n=1 Tax=Colocasia esculenta TaxID=4460 RepID=A0A843UZU7_COLES|nr:hypothetical protein [Colocasia esculenta]